MSTLQEGTEELDGEPIGNLCSATLKGLGVWSSYNRCVARFSEHASEDGSPIFVSRHSKGPV